MNPTPSSDAFDKNLRIALATVDHLGLKLQPDPPAEPAGIPDRPMTLIIENMGDPIPLQPVPLFRPPTS